MDVILTKEHYLYPGTIFADKDNYIITTVLGSCVSVCLWDRVQKIGCINHYMLPFQVPGEASARYGDSATYQLLKVMTRWNCQKKDVVAKVFGGGNVLEIISAQISVGERNIQVAREILMHEKIDIVSSDVGGENGRKLKFDTSTGIVSIKKIAKRNFIGEYLI